MIAYGAGGALETVRDLAEPRPTGLFFDAQTPEAIRQAVRRFEDHGSSIDPADCRANAERFAAPLFRRCYRSLVADAWRRHGGGIDRPEEVPGEAKVA